MVDLSDFEKSENIELAVYNSMGQRVYFNTIASNVTTVMTLRVPPQSLYILKAKQRNKEYHWKLVKENKNNRTF